MKIKGLLAVALMSIAYSFVGLPVSGDSIMPGAMCQARQGSQQGSLVHGIMGTGNNFGGRGSTVDVVCPLVRSSPKSTAGPRVKVYVARSGNSGALSLTCTLHVRTPQGVESATVTKPGFSLVGEATLEFSLPKVNADDYYLVLCSLPFEGAIRSIILEP